MEATKITTRLIDAKQVSSMMGISMSSAYKLIDQLNGELQKAGYLTIRGKVDMMYLERRFFPSDEKMLLLGQEGA